MPPLPLSASRPASARGEFSDWTTQLWVKVTGRRFPLDQVPWLAGPVGNPAGIGSGYFDELAGAEGWTVRRGGPACGLLPDFGALAGPTFPAARVHRAVTDFYERTSAYDLEAWSEWCGLFRPFGALLAIMFSRRLQQLNVPLSPLDTSLGTTSEVLQLVDPDTGGVRLTAWVRHLRRTGHVLYAGRYSVCRVPGYPGRSRLLFHRECGVRRHLGSLRPKPARVDPGLSGRGCWGAGRPCAFTVGGHVPAPPLPPAAETGGGARCGKVECTTLAAGWSGASMIRCSVARPRRCNSRPGGMFEAGFVAPRIGPVPDSARMGLARCWSDPLGT
jgi:hypothetical protein